MPTSIFFTESKDFKLIKERILSQEDIYLVYVFADTSNIRIPKELIKELPIYGNNLIWIDSANMDFTDLSNHIIFTIGQLMDPEEEISFYIATRTSKMERTVFFLRNQGIPVEIIGPVQKAVVEVPAAPVEKTVKRKKKKSPAEKEPVKEKKRGRGRPKKEEKVIKEETVIQEKATPEVQKKRGRPKKEKPFVEDAGTPAVAKKRGRPGKQKAEEDFTAAQPEVTKGRKKTAAKKTTLKKPGTKKEASTRKPRVVKVPTGEEIAATLAAYPTEDPNVEMVLKTLIPMKKISRPKLAGKLIEMIKGITAEDDTVAEQILNQLVEFGFMVPVAEGGRLSYKD